MNKDKDYNLESGERQIANNVSEIRRDHTIRYEFAFKIIEENGPWNNNSCLDIFCGNGYGTYMLSERFPEMVTTGYDGSKDAISMAIQYYSNNNNEFVNEIFPFNIKENTYDLVICFESLEHVKEDRLMLNLMLHSLKSNGYLLISFPNQKHHPLEKNPHKFHYRHYSHFEFISMIPAPFVIDNWYGQNIYKFTDNKINTYCLLNEKEMYLSEKKEGQVNLYIIRRNSVI